MKKYLILLLMVLILAGNVFAYIEEDIANIQTQLNEMQTKLNTYDEKINGIDEQVNTAVETSLNGITADLKYFKTQIENLQASQEELTNKINSLESKINSIENKADKSEVNSLKEELNTTKTELSSVKTMTEETTNAFNTYYAKILAEEEKNKNNPLAGLFNLGETSLFPIMIGLLILATIGLIVFGYMRKEDWLPEKEEGKGILTFLNKEETKNLTEFDEEELEPEKKGKWAIE